MRAVVWQEGRKFWKYRIELTAEEESELRPRVGYRALVKQDGDATSEARCERKACKALALWRSERDRLDARESLRAETERVVDCSGSGG